MKTLVAYLIAYFVICVASILFGQSPEGKPETLKPTEIQAVKLENLQLKARIAQQNWVLAKSQYDASMSALLQYCEDVKKENAWEKSVSCDPNTLTFSNAPLKPVEKTQPGAAAVHSDKEKK